MIRLSTFEPKYFNNNGDQGNIEVLRFSLDSRNLASSLDTVITIDSDFVLVGDASRAVMREYSPQLSSLVEVLAKRLELGKATLLVGSSWEYFAPLLGIEVKMGERLSAFVMEQSQGESVMGYHNSLVSQGRLFIHGLFTGTTLYGPLLAKNPDLLAQLLVEMGTSGELEDWQKEFPKQIWDKTTFG